MYKIHPSVYEKADPALLELIERAQVGNLSDDEYLRYEAELQNHPKQNLLHLETT